MEADFPDWKRRLRSFVGSMREVQSVEEGGASIQSSRWGFSGAGGDGVVLEGACDDDDEGR